MHKIIHPLFEIDLNNTSITLLEENDWFSDTFKTKYSFPFTSEITDEMREAFADVLDDNSKEITTDYEVIYAFNNVREKAILSIVEISDSLSFQLKYGIEEFPNFNKKLSELGLEIKVTTDIYAHAKTVITQAWPAVNYNFPQIHTDKIDTSIPMWSYFLKILNNYKDGDFVINEVIDDTPHNRNLMQPLPYFLHILTQGFAQKGYVLKGDVLEISELQKKLLFTETDYHKILDQVNIDTIILGSDRISTSGNEAFFSKAIQLPQGGRYRITGTINLYGRWKESVFATLSYKNQIIWSVSKYEKRHHSGHLYYYDLDVTFDTVNDGFDHYLHFTSSQFRNDNNVIADFYVTSLFLYNEMGVAIPNVVNNNTVELGRVVPDLTFGEFVTVIKNWYNLDLTLKNDEIWMNHIESEINYDNAIDLSNFETKPTKIPNKGQSFLLKFLPASDENNNHQEMYFNAEGSSTTQFTPDDKTIEIKIQAFPLPNVMRDGVQTAHAIESDKGKIYAVLYDGLDAAGLNLTKDPAPILIPSIAKKYYKKWLDFRLFAINYKWSFTAFIESLNKLTVKSKIWGFKRYHIINNITKQQIRKDEFEVEMDTYTLK